MGHLGPRKKSSSKDVPWDAYIKKIPCMLPHAWEKSQQGLLVALVLDGTATVLDLGCGSGILSIAALLLGDGG